MRTESRVEKIFAYDKALYSLMCVWLVPFCLIMDKSQTRMKNTPWVAVPLLLLLTISIWTTIASQVAFSTVFHSILSLFVIAVPSWLLLRLSKTM